MSSVTVKRPAEDNDIFSAAASEAPVLKLNFVALDEELKSPSDTASIPAATKIASVPVPSSGAWKLIAPRTSSAAISVSPVCSVNTKGLSSPVAADLKNRPSSGSCVTTTSWSLPN